MKERDVMVQTLVDRLGVDAVTADEALMAAFDAVAIQPVKGGWTPQPSNQLVGAQLARRIELAVSKELQGEPLFPCCIIVQEPETGQFGLAAISLAAEDVPRFLLLGRGAAARALREQN